MWRPSLAQILLGLIAVVAVLGVWVYFAQPAPRGTGSALSQTPRATTRNTPRPTPTRTAEPTPTRAPESLDPEFAYELWLTTFETSFWEPMQIQLADAVETDFYWIASVDRASWESEANRIVIDATVDFEVVYQNDPLEWRSDTWDLYQAWSRELWGSFVEGFEAGNADVGVDTDWPRWTPALVLNGNAGRLTASCPGALIYEVSQRNATQTEFLARCSFVP